MLFFAAFVRYIPNVHRSALKSESCIKNANMYMKIWVLFVLLNFVLFKFLFNFIVL